MSKEMRSKEMRNFANIFSRYAALYILMLVWMLSSCARMGSPDGGWYDEFPPRVVSTSPADKGTDVHSKKITITFDEYVKIDNPSEKVVISPPQLEQPEIKAQGKRIVVALKDSLIDNTTYTIDFSDAISDFTEDNPMGNYAYSFSTGDHIDTLQVSGTVIEAENLEPVKGILVGLYAINDVIDPATGKPVSDEAFKGTDTLFTTQKFLRVSRTDSRGHFVIKGIAPGSYRVYALQDMDGDYAYKQKAEKIAFNHDVIVPTFKPDTRQDTIWRDSLHIENIIPVGYTHFLPDDIVLKAFTEEQTNRNFIKYERKEADNFTLFFTYGSPELPEIRGLNFDDFDAFLIEANEKKDTITYWLKDTTLVNQDTLLVQMQYMMTDTLGVLVQQNDTLQILAKLPYEKRQKLAAEEYEKWQKKQEKQKKQNKPYQEQMPPKALEVDIQLPGRLDPDKTILMDIPAPLAALDTAAIHLYSKIDTLWYKSRFLIREVPNQSRRYELLGEWRPATEYSLEIDSAAFTDIYGKTSSPFKRGFSVPSLDEYSTIIFTINGMEGKNLVVQLLNSQDKPVKEMKTTDGNVQFDFLKPEKYYARLFVDENGNGVWNTGDYAADRQPEEVSYYPDVIECRAKWDMRLSWNPTARPANQQKPGAIIQTKADKQKTIKHRNAERALKMGIELPAYLQHTGSDY